MSNPLQTDEWIVSTLRDAEIPAPPQDLMNWLLAADPPRRTGLKPVTPVRIKIRAPLVGRWLAASGAATVVGLIVFATGMRPTALLADVAEAQKGETRYTEIMDMVLPDGNIMRSTLYADHGRWSMRASNLDANGNLRPNAMPGFYGGSVMDGKSTLNFDYSAGVGETVVQIDDPSPDFQLHPFDMRRMVAHDTDVSVSRGRIWNGRKVDIFQSQAMEPVYSGKARVHRMVIADAETHLPLREEKIFDNHQGEWIWTYRYGPPSPEVFNYEIPNGAIVYDFR